MKPLNVRDEGGPGRAEAAARRLAGDDLPGLIGRLHRAHPDLVPLYLEAAFGGILSRPGLDPPGRMLVAVAALGALGASEDLMWHLRAARRAGVSAAEIHEVFFQLVPYCGWAVALNAYNSLRQALPEEAAELAKLMKDGVPADEPARADLRARGWENARRVNPQFDRVAAGLGGIDPELVHHLTESAYGAVYGRPGLSLSKRELVAVAVLAVARQTPQLKYHLQGALNAGVTPVEIREALLQTSLYAGWPAAIGALEAFQEVTTPARTPVSRRSPGSSE